MIIFDFWTALLGTTLVLAFLAIVGTIFIVIAQFIHRKFTALLQWIFNPSVRKLSEQRKKMLDGLLHRLEKIDKAATEKSANLDPQEKSAGERPGLSSGEVLPEAAPSSATIPNTQT